VKEHCYRCGCISELFSLSCSRDTKQSSGEGGCTVRTQYYVNALCILATRCLQMLSKRSLWLPCDLLPLLDELRSIIQHLTLWNLNHFASDDTLQLLVRQLLMTFSFWWRRYFRSTSLQERFTSDALSFIYLDFFALFCSFRIFVRYKILSMVLYTWTNISNTNCQFLIPCYHQNSLRFIVKHILFQQSPPFWWWQTIVFKTWSIVVNLINKLTYRVWGL